MSQSPGGKGSGKFPDPLKGRTRDKVGVSVEVAVNKGRCSMEICAQEFTELIESMRDRGLNIPDEVIDLRGLIIAVKAGGGPRRRAVVPLRPRIIEADGSDLDPAAEVPAGA